MTPVEVPEVFDDIIWTCLASGSTVDPSTTAQSPQKWVKMAKNRLFWHISKRAILGCFWPFLPVFEGCERLLMGPRCSPKPNKSKTYHRTPRRPPRGPKNPKNGRFFKIAVFGQLAPPTLLSLAQSETGDFPIYDGFSTRSWDIYAPQGAKTYP